MTTECFVDRVKDILSKHQFFAEDDICVKRVSHGFSLSFCGILVCRIIELKTKTNRLEIKTDFLASNYDEDWLKADFTDIGVNVFLDEALNVYNACLLFGPTETFGCCDKFIACSDAKRCVHPDPHFRRSCYYRARLESGIIYYGKNKNYSRP